MKRDYETRLSEHEARYNQLLDQLDKTSLENDKKDLEVSRLDRENKDLEKKNKSLNEKIVEYQKTNER